MSSVRSQISVSLDGYVAGPDPTLEEPLGAGGERLHEWAFATAAWHEQHGRAAGERTADDAIVAGMHANVGAVVMGRGMFGGGPGPWDDAWKGWWGDDPPYHVPVFVLTHHAREPVEMLGGTTFTFVTGGIEAAIEQARAAAGDADVLVAGGASTIDQALAAGLLDELFLHVVPIVLGGGARLFEGVGSGDFAPVEVVASPAVTHVRYRVVR